MRGVIPPPRLTRGSAPLAIISWQSRKYVGNAAFCAASGFIRRLARIVIWSRLYSLPFTTLVARGSTTPEPIKQRANATFMG